MHNRDLPNSLNDVDAISYLLHSWHVDHFVTLTFDRPVEWDEAKVQMLRFGEAIRDEFLTEHPDAHVDGIEFFVLPDYSRPTLKCRLFVNCCDPVLFYERAHEVWRAIEPAGDAEFCDVGLRALQSLRPDISRHYWNPSAIAYIKDVSRRLWFSTNGQQGWLLGKRMKAIVAEMLYEFGDDNEL